MSDARPPFPVDRKAWQQLADSALEPNPFFSPTWMQAALEHLAEGGVRLATTSDAGGRLIALAPIRPTRLGRLVPALSVWTHLYGPIGTPLIDPLHPDEAIAKLVAILDGGGAVSRTLVFPDLTLDGPVADGLRRHAAASGRPIAAISAYPRAVLTRPDGGRARIRETIAPKKRKELGRQLRRLADQGTVTLDRITAPAQLSEALDAFLALESSGWKGERGTALALKAEALAFARAAIRDAGDGEVAIDAIRLDGRPIAMLVCFRSGDLAVTWKIAHDEAFARFSPGVQVMLDASDRMLADPSVRLVDSLAAVDHPMVDAIWAERRTVGTLVIGPKRNRLAFHVGVALARAEAAARPRIRDFLRRRRKPRPSKEASS